MTTKDTLVLNNKEYVVLPLNLKTIIEISPLLKSMENITAEKMPTTEDFKNITQIVFSALRRGNPEITFDEVAEGLDMQNMMQALTVIMSVSGAVNRGEVKAVKD